ncbi:protein rapunzel-like [Stigmatopora argus]
MSDELMENDRSKLKSGMIQAIKCLSSISSAAAAVNPIFGVAGALLRVVLHYVDDEDIVQLKRQFGEVHRGLDDISRKNHQVLMAIRKETLDTQYSSVEENLKNQFRKYMELVEALPKHRQAKKEDFIEAYARNKGDQNLHTLYDGVMGTVKLFSRPILEVYLTHSGGDRTSMERLCTRLTYLFCIGLIALMGYSALLGDDEEGISKEWAKNMQHVEEKMQQMLAQCRR